MLAENFKTAEELRLGPMLYAALKLVLRNLELGVLQHDFALSFIADKPTGFNMCIHFARHSCGSVGCIAGWAGHYMGVDWSEVIISSPHLHNLFYPQTQKGWESITTDQAAYTLRNYLTTSVISWDHLEQPTVELRNY